MKHIPLLASLFGCLPLSLCASAWAQTSIDLAPITIDGETNAEPGLSLDQSSGMASRLGLSVRDTPASVAIANRNDIERHGAQNFQDAANTLPGVNASAPPGVWRIRLLSRFHQQPDHPDVQRHQRFRRPRPAGGRVDL